MEVSRKPVKKPLKYDDMTKEQIREAIVKKRECNAKAQKIVESLLEKNITCSYLLKCLNDINQSHFEDIIEERAIIYLCGYPICNNNLSDIDIKQQYRISLKTNRVFDIKTRKHFCSNACYKSAMYLKNQMLTSPLWFREYEEMPVFNILPLDSKASMGQEVNLLGYESCEIGKNNIEKAETSLTTSIKNNEDDLSSEMKEESIKRKSEANENICNVKCVNMTQTNNKTLKSAISKNQLIKDVIEKTNHEKLTNSQIHIDTENKCIKNHQQKSQPSNTILSEVEASLSEWFTLDTVIFLFGAEKVKQMVSEREDFIEEYLKNYHSSDYYKASIYDQYQNLCRKLNLLDLEEKRLSEEKLGKETKPLPDYSVLKEESNNIQLKVKAYLSGQMEMSDPISEQDENSEEDSQNPTFFPLLDKNCQNALRRRIVCEQLNRALPDLLRSLGLSTFSICSEVKLLVSTFRLNPKNVMFKPIQWTLISIVVIKLLSLRDKKLEYSLKQPTAFKHLQLLLLSYKQDDGYLDRLIMWLTDVNRFLSKKSDGSAANNTL